MSIQSLSLDSAKAQVQEDTDVSHYLWYMGDNAKKEKEVKRLKDYASTDYVGNYGAEDSQMGIRSLLWSLIRLMDLSILCLPKTAESFM